AAGSPGLTPLLVLDLISATFAIGTLLFVHIPNPERSASGREAEGGFWHQAMYGLRYILTRPSLVGLQLVFLAGNFFHSLGFSIGDPMILARTGSDQLAFGSIRTAAALGGIVGGLILGAWGGFRRRVHGVLLGWTLGGVAMVAMGMVRSLVPWLVTGFIGMLFTPLINSSNQALWQAKVPPDIQGRVFATRRLIAWLVTPISQLAAGPLADYVFEPAFGSGALGGSVLGRLFGTGAGAGMGFQMGLGGAFVVLVGLSGYLFPAIREAEDRLPDHDLAPEVTDTVAEVTPA
ncbi:MAG: MFS transporter, partial [Anaerolineae bacterium]